MQTTVFLTVHVIHAYTVQCMYMYGVGLAQASPQLFSFSIRKQIAM